MDLVQLNVGGRPFATTRSTLCSQRGMLAAMFSGSTTPTEIVDEQGRYFIDRDGKHFATILNYLRDGQAVLPLGQQERLELRSEAEYYNVTGLAAAVDASLGPERPTVRAAWRNLLEQIEGDMEGARVQLMGLQATLRSHYNEYAGESEDEGERIAPLGEEGLAAAQVLQRNLELLIQLQAQRLRATELKASHM